MTTTSALDAQLAAADAAAGRGDLAAARDRLRAILADHPDRADLWLRLAAAHRATREPEAALAAVDRALALGPLDFLALLFKANLLDQTGSPAAGEAFGHALAQRPDETPRPAVARMIEVAEAKYARHIEARDAAIRAALSPVVAAASPEEAARLSRLRTNSLRQTRVYHSEPIGYHYPGLREREFHDRAGFPWLADLEAQTDAIAAELAALLEGGDARLEPYVQYPDHIPARQWTALNHSADWTAIHLLRRGERIEPNAARCPRTMAAVAALPQPHVPARGPNAMFSLLVPGAHIPPHTGIANTRLVCHLPLVVPPSCWFRVGAETRAWERGVAFVFDDTIEHEAANESEEARIVLIVDVWHPDLSATERAGVAAVLGLDPGGDGDG